MNQTLDPAGKNHVGRLAPDEFGRFANRLGPGSAGGDRTENRSLGARFYRHLTANQIETAVGIGERVGSLSGPDFRFRADHRVQAADSRRERGSNALGVAVVDLQDLGLGEIQMEAGRLRLGAMTRLVDLDSYLLAQDEAEDGAEPGNCAPLLRKAIRQAGPNTYRNAATIGGIVGARLPDSELLAALRPLAETYGPTPSMLDEGRRWNRQNFGGG